MTPKKRQATDYTKLSGPVAHRFLLRMKDKKNWIGRLDTGFMSMLSI
jgi:hypothetical protein